MDLFDIKQKKLPVNGSLLEFPVNRVYCVGRNYTDHVIEMGGDIVHESPFYFIKSTDTLFINGGDVNYPSMTDNLHHEIELVVAIHKGGKNIQPEDALEHVFGYAVGIDLTRRDLQSEAKKLGRPWDTGKTFNQAAPISPLQLASDIGHPVNGKIQLMVNNLIRQDGDINEMIWSVPESIARLSSFFELVPGDILFTGTPSGVSKIVLGDNIKGKIDGIGYIEINII
jgi:fumarylpyruvate hydrolase